MRLSLLIKKISRIWKNVAQRSQGVALILTLLILLTLILLGLALMLQTDTEYLIAVNEQDSLETFHYAEAGMNWTKRIVLDTSNASGFTTFTDFLDGPDNADGTADDNLIALRTIDTTITDEDLLTDDNEQTSSAVVTKNFGDGNKTYEAFRMGINETGDAEWDGPRAVVYVRIDDNYDEYPAANAPLTDADQIITASVVSEYPVFVNDDGVPSPGTRTVARRYLTARFGVNNAQPAILARRSLKLSGNAIACGECGSIHANDNIYGDGDLKICQDLTVSDPTMQMQPGYVAGDEKGGGFDEIPVPIINPYSSVMVPDLGDFSDAQMQDFAGLNCGPDTPKYFAFVSNNNKGLVFKAVWENTTPREDNNGGGGWKWKLIDDLNEGGNTRLDDCGRVVCGTVNGVSVHEIGNGVCDSGENWVNDDKDDEFYGFKQNDPITSFTNCSGDVTLSSSSTLAENDFNTANFYCSSANSNFCPVDNQIYNSNYRLLPGGFNDDGIRDYEDRRFEDGKARWITTTDLVHSPVYNAVIWVYGRIDLTHNPGAPGAKICTSASSGLANKKCESSDSAALSGFGGYWRVSFIAVDSINISGNPQFSTSTSSFPFLMVAGRDMIVSGTAESSETVCQGTLCQRNLGNSEQYAGILAAHEQMRISSSASFDGFIIIEDAVQCSNLVQRETSTDNPIDFSTGSFNIHYDCVNPPNPWGGKVSMTSWSEIQ